MHAVASVVRIAKQKKNKMCSQALVPFSNLGGNTINEAVLTLLQAGGAREEIRLDQLVPRLQAEMESTGKWLPASRDGGGWGGGSVWTGRWASEVGKATVSSPHCQLQVDTREGPRKLNSFSEKAFRVVAPALETQAADPERECL